MQNKAEKKFEMIKLSPQVSAGNCGYDVVITGLLYLALRAKQDNIIADAINSSDAIKQLLSKIPDSISNHLRDKPYQNNVECLQNYLDAMGSEHFENLLFTEFVNSLSKELKEICYKSDWFTTRIKNEIKSGLWADFDRNWEKLPGFKPILTKITIAQDELYSAAPAKQQNVRDELFKILFNARINVCSQLSDEELKIPVKEVIDSHLSNLLQGSWIDIGHIHSLVIDLLGSSKFMFDKQYSIITGDGPSEDHWYIELPNDELSQKFLSIYKNGYQSGLSVVLPKGSVEVSLTSFDQNLFFFTKNNEQRKNPDNKQRPGF